VRSALEIWELFEMTLSWISIIRLGLVQMCLGAVVVLMTSTLNRLMVVELSLAATLPGALVAIHYLVQISRPKWGFISDMQGNRTKWIILGMLILALGANLAALCILLHPINASAAILLSFVAYILIGVGGWSFGDFITCSFSSSHNPAQTCCCCNNYMAYDDFWYRCNSYYCGKIARPLLRTKTY
jgi:BCD family chlorophyll transporter-like MFS transporter